MYWYFSPKIVDTPGCASAITANVTGMMRRDAYLTDCWKTGLRVSGSFCALIFENAGKRIVATGVTNNAIRTAKFVATV